MKCSPRTRTAVRFCYNQQSNYERYPHFSILTHDKWSLFHQRERQKLCGVSHFIPHYQNDNWFFHACFCMPQEQLQHCIIMYGPLKWASIWLEAFTGACKINKLFQFIVVSNFLYAIITNDLFNLLMHYHQYRLVSQAD